ncbi:MAG: hypothetical protein H6741_11715 [Alphaproteobacteria bacterium]|nr:hypothetical protein [Alphaproteobacteria bacterium]MCB9793378.1 hypothetical protein [Alphaproteobacteria bacterium]
MSLLLLSLLACGEDPAAQLDREALPEVAAPAQDVGLTDPSRQGGRELRRMNIDQLAASIERLTGHGWTEQDESGASVDLFQSLSGSLGKPDYLDATEEDLVPGLLFQKFLDDAAKSACVQLVAEESAGGGGHLRVQAELDEDADSAAVRADLARALLLFHGRQVSPDDDAALGPWIWLMGQARAATGEPESAWRALCVGLLTHPDFYSY